MSFKGSGCPFTNSASASCESSITWSKSDAAIRMPPSFLLWGQRRRVSANASRVLSCSAKSRLRQPRMQSLAVRLEESQRRIGRRAVLRPWARVPYRRGRERPCRRRDIGPPPLREKYPLRRVDVQRAHCSLMIPLRQHLNRRSNQDATMSERYIGLDCENLRVRAIRGGRLQIEGERPDTGSTEKLPIHDGDKLIRTRKGSREVWLLVK